MLDLAQATQRQMLYLRAYELGYVSQFLNALPRQTAYDIVLKLSLIHISPASSKKARMMRAFFRCDDCRAPCDTGHGGNREAESILYRPKR